MAIVSFDDVPSIVEWWDANNVTTTGAVVDTMVGQVESSDLTNPSVWESDPSLISDYVTGLTDAVDMTYESRSKLEGATSQSTLTADVSLFLAFGMEDDSVDTPVLVTYAAWSAGWLVQSDNGTIEVTFETSFTITGPTLVNGDLCEMIAVRDTTTSYLYWRVNDGTIQSASLVHAGNERVGDFRLGSNAQSAIALIAMGQAAEALGSSDRDDIFDLLQSDYLVGGGGATYEELASTVSGTATTVGDVLTSVQVEATGSGTATTMGDVLTSVQVEATGSGAATTVGGLSVGQEVELASTVSGAATTVGDVHTSVQVEATGSGAATTVGDVLTSVRLEGAPSGLTTLVGGLAGDAALSSVVSGTASTVGALGSGMPLAVTAAGQGAVLASLVAAGPDGLEAASGGVSVASGALATTMALGASLVGLGSLVETLAIVGTSPQAVGFGVREGNNHTTGVRSSASGETGIR